MSSFYFFTTFTIEVKLLWHMYKYVLNTLLDRMCIFKQTYRNVLFRCYILTLALYTEQSTYVSLNTGGIKFLKLIIVWNISNLFYSKQTISYHIRSSD